MPDRLMKPLAALVLDRPNLRALGNAQPVGRHRPAADQGRPNPRLTLAADQQNPVKRDRLLVLTDLPVDQNRVPARDLMLTSTVFNNCVHVSLWLRKFGKGRDCRVSAAN